MANAVDKLGWKLMGVGTATAAATATRKAAERVYQSGLGEAPPENPSSPEVPLRQAILWAALSGVVVGLVRLLVERTAAAAWVRARGELPPGLLKPEKKDKGKKAKASSSDGDS
jgi:uncharacterized protein DUF4235